MTEAASNDIIKDVKDSYDKITEYSKKAQLDSFLSYYDDSPYFLSVSADGKMSNYEEFKNACGEYYNSLKEQRIITTQEKFQVLDETLVIVGWTGNIIANFKNGDIVKMNNYSITSVFKKIDGRWKVIHDHESALPPEIIKRE
jgi:ketosteroid isomerase-like protein